jgi:hypothetical protein
MKNKLFLILLLLIGYNSKAQYPEARITNGLIDAHLYLPDAEKGFYRGTRFDWAGVISSLRYNEHEYFGQWYNKHDPLKHDAIQGPVEAFEPIGYKNASPGETFLIIGVGMVRKADSSPYRFSRPLEIINGGKWTVVRKKDRIIFTHELNDERYAYVYKKTVRLTKNKPELVLEHSLKNTGNEALETYTFNHNFFMIDHQTTGPDFTITFPFRINNEAAGKDLMTFSDRQLRYLRELKQGEHTMEYPTGFSGDQVRDYDMIIENSKTGAGVKITSDKPLARFAFWSVPSTISPEPFIKISAMPRKEFRWNINYQFFTNQ